MKNFESILKENNIIMIHKKYPSRNECLEYETKNFVKVYQLLHTNEQLKLLEQFYKQFFKSVRLVEYCFILDDKYTVHSSHKFPFFELYYNINTKSYTQTGFCSESQLCTPKPINMNLKNVNNLEKQIKSYCEYLDLYAAWVKKKINEEQQKKNLQECFKIDTTETIKTMFPKAKFYHSTIEINQYIDLSIKKDYMKIEINLNQNRLSNDQILKISKFIDALN